RRCISSRLGDCPNVEVTVTEGRYRGWGRRRTRSVGLQRGREARRWPGEPRVAVSTGGCRPAPAHEALFGQRLLHRTRCRLPSPTLPPRSAVELRASTASSHSLDSELAAPARTQTADSNLAYSLTLTIVESISARDDAPDRDIVRSSSAMMFLSTDSTPLAPSMARPYTCGRPIVTA